jgi:hypothetical protein
LASKKVDEIPEEFYDNIVMRLIENKVSRTGQGRWELGIGGQQAGR